MIGGEYKEIRKAYKSAQNLLSNRHLHYGGAIGAYGASHFLGSFFSHGSTSSEIVAIKDKIFTLSKLRGTNGESLRTSRNASRWRSYLLFYGHWRIRKHKKEH